MEKIYIGAMSDRVIELTTVLRKRWVLQVVAVPVSNHYSVGLVASPMAYGKRIQHIEEVMVGTKFKSLKEVEEACSENAALMVIIARKFSEMINGRLL